MLTMNPDGSSPPPSSATATAPTAASSCHNAAAPAATADAATAGAASSASAAASSATTVDQHLARTIHALDQLVEIFGFPRRVAREAIEECGPEDVARCYNWILDNTGADDKGGPVVPRTDCPHVARHVRFRVAVDEDGDGEKRMRIANDIDGGSSSSSAFNLPLNLMTSECQHVALRRNVSRKRLRSEEDAVGRLKREEDYDASNNEEDACEVAGEGGTSKKQWTSSPRCPRGENWLCLECGALLCSRYANGHAKMHYEDTKEEGRAAVAAAVKGGDYEVHGSEEGHCIAVSLADLSVWCYGCNAYLRHPSLDAITKHLEELKFGKDSDDGRGEAEEIDGGNENDGRDASDAMEEDDQPVGDVDITGPALAKPPNQATAAISNSDESGEHGAAISSPSMNKRKGTPQKLPPEQVGTTQQPMKSNVGRGDESNGDDDESIDESDSSSSSSSSLDEDQAALIASLLQAGHGDALRAYLSRHESFDAGDMGQCVPGPSVPPPSFPDGMADFLNSPLCKSVVVLAGAGMSVSSGIPDFRSAGSGLYDTLRPELLTATEEEQALIEDDPTLALDKGMFLRNPLPMLETKRSFILGTYEKRWKATLAHRFVELLHSRLGKLTRLYTQNIDGLELQTTLPKEKVICVHGTMGAAACERCGHEADFDDFCNEVRSNIKDISGQDADAPAQSSPIICEACKAPTVKPTIVLFRGSMPSEFHVRTAQDLPDCDLLIIMGTSLTVAPANSLVYRIPPTAFRMVMNNERVGRRLGIDYGEDSLRDVWAQGYTDETCLDLCEKMGWLDDLARTVDDLPDSSARLLRERLARRQQQQEEDEDAGMS